jgi:protein-S-isoprenylcysteine O-methyltransferase Ste14
MTINNWIQHYWEKFAEHEHRPDVAGEHPLGDLFQGIFMVVFLAAILIDRWTIKSNALLTPFIPLWSRIMAAAIILAFAWILAMGGLKTVFGEVREKPVVINEGPFSRTRHPIYLGAILVYLAGVVLSLSLVGTFLFVIIFLYYHFLARYEEKLLIKKFGDDYRKYMQRVPMWLPCPIASKNT